jgi:hypothetical protein
LSDDRFHHPSFIFQQNKTRPSNIEFPGFNVIKLFTAVIYHHSMVMPSFCVIKQHYIGNYCRMAINYCSICVTNVIKHNLT